MFRILHHQFATYGLLFALLMTSGCQLIVSSGDGADQESDQDNDIFNLSDADLYAQPESELDSGREQQAIKDPMTVLQWHLSNQGQSHSTLDKGVPGEDLNAFSALDLTLAHYADGFTGQAVAVLVLDTGAEISHPDLQANFMPYGSYNFGSNFNGYSELNPVNDGLFGDHGTSVSGILAARAENGKGGMGVAPKARLRAFNLLSYGELEDEIAAYGAIADSRFDVSQVQVINKSYGYNPEFVGDEAETMEQTLAAMKTATEQGRDGKGVVFVKAAGNEYDVPANGRPYSWCQPANDLGLTCFNVNQETESATPYQIVVGAFNALGKRASYSNTGSALWVVAPGGEDGEDAPAIMTTDQQGCDYGYSQSTRPVVDNDFELGVDGTGNESCDYTRTFNGTSSATPMVSGVAALLLEANPNLKWYEVKHILAKTARQIDPNLANTTMRLGNQSFELEAGWVTNQSGIAFSNEYGFGAVDVLAAVKMAKDFTPLANFKTSDVAESKSDESRLQVLDQDPDGARVHLELSESMTLQTVEVTLSLTALEDSTLRKENKIDPSDYWIALTSPQGTKSVLMTPLNSYLSGYNMNRLTLVSHAFLGESSVGTWQLQVVDVDGDSRNFIAHKGEAELSGVQLRVYGY